jgi:hypothetical protein
MDFSGFFSGLLGGLIATVIGGALVLYLGYRFIDRKLRLEDESTRRRELEEHRRQNRDAVLRAVYGELENTAAMLTTALTVLPTGAVPYPLFDLKMRPDILEPTIFASLSTETITALTQAYNRMETSNEMMALLSDLNHGPTAVLVAMNAAPSMDDPLVKDTYKKFLKHRDEVRIGVIERLDDLKPYLDIAIDAVEAELEIDRQPPAAQRLYRSDSAVGFIGDPKTLPPPPSVR